MLQQVAIAAHALLALQPGQRVLEVGCGSGVFLPGLAEKVQPTGRVFGLDHSDALIAEARKASDATPHAAIITTEVGDAYKLPYPDGFFDAAHCERVLMHLGDPTAAIREMARVVRPGGVVVAAEPDWAGIRIDHPDQEIFRTVYLRALTARQVDIGMTLNRRFAEAGLVDRHFSPVAAPSTDFAVIRMYGLKLEPAVEALLAEGQLPVDRLRAVVPALEHASSAGTYYSVGIMHVVSGRIPE
jgi:SAM-dependent methyltransferase